MSARPVLADLYCGAGGAAWGYYLAGFAVVGFDILPQPDYPFECWQRDALSLTYSELQRFDAIHASPPCQQYSQASALARRRGKVYPDLYRQTRAMLAASGLPYIIENVPGSPAKGIGLCGTQFGLKVKRHRLFESNVPLRRPGHDCTCAEIRIGQNGYVTVAGSSSTLRQAARAMLVEWIRSKRQVNEAIPPAYTQFLGQQLLSYVGQPVAPCRRFVRSAAQAEPDFQQILF